MTTNLTTFQSRAYAAFVFIDGDVSRFRINLNGINYTHLISGIMVIISLLIFVGKVANSQQATMAVDLMQAIIFSSKILVIVLRAMAWGMLGI